MKVETLTPESKSLMDSPTSSKSVNNATYKNPSDDIKFIIGYPAESPQEDNVMCGAGNWRPSCLQRFANIRVFTLVLSLMSFLNGVVFAYYNAVITSIENRFGLNSSTMGFLKNVDNIGYLLTIIVVSHFGRYANKPRLFAAACVLSSVATLLFAFPHFIYGGGDDAEDLFNSANGNFSSDFPKGLTHFCDPSGSAAEDRQCKRETSSVLGKFNAGALAIFIVSEILQGMSNAPGTSLGITYLDDNAKGSDSPKFFGKDHFRYQYTMHMLLSELVYSYQICLIVIFFPNMS